ncbi:MAG TPA: hypothetical protein PLR60_01170 [Syntrophorhabdaceae bacterium]|nr:hypothetical protein [Syntrophorhabdaceae bacterium]
MLKEITHIKHYVLVCILMLGSTGLCFAEDFTFNVPIALYNMPAQYSLAKTRCQCTSKTGSQNTKTGQHAPPVGYGEKDLPIINGTCVGTAVIRFNAASGANPADATDWSCVLLLFDKKTGKWYSADQLMYNAHNRSKPFKTYDQGYLK